MQLTSWDWVIIVVYMAAMIAVGLWAMRQIKDCGGYLLGKRKMGKLLMIASSFGVGISSNHPISVASASYQKGLSGIWVSLAYMFVTPFYWLFPPVFRRARIVTMVDFIRLRYGRVMELLYNASTLIGGSIAIGMGIKTAGVVICVMSGGALSEFWAQAIIVGLILAYSDPGGHHRRLRDGRRAGPVDPRAVVPADSLRGAPGGAGSRGCTPRCPNGSSLS